MPYVPYLVLVAIGGGLVVTLRRHPDSRWAKAAFGAFAIAAIALLCIRSTGRATPFGDFDKAYYAAGRVVLSEPARLYECPNPDGLCFVNVPIVAVLFAPFAALPKIAGYVLFTVIGAAALVVMVAGLFVLTGARGWHRYAIVAMLLLNGPLYYSIRLGNTTHMVLMMIVLAFIGLSYGRNGRAGALLAIAALIKPPLVIWLPYFVVRREWRAALTMGLTIALAVAASLLWFGPGLHAIWLEQFVTGPSSKPMGAYNVQSVSGFLVRLTTSGTLVSWFPVEIGAGFRAVQIVLSALVVGVAVAAGIAAGRPRSTAERLREYSIVLIVMLALSPISWTHYYCFLLVPLAALTARAIGVSQHPVWLAAAAVAGVLVSLPVMLWVPAHPFWGAVIARILLSHYFFGAMLLLGVLAAASVVRHFRAAASTALPLPA